MPRRDEHGGRAEAVAGPSTGDEPTPRELLDFIRTHEPLAATRRRFGLTRERIEEMLAPGRAGGSGHGRRKRVRVYCDGASRGNPGPAGAGAVVTDPTGAVVARVGRFLGEATNNVAEYQGLLLGLAKARELGATEVEIVADSELLVRQIDGAYRVKHPNLRPLHAEVMEALQAFERWSARHVPRERNAEADTMSNRAIDERM